VGDDKKRKVAEDTINEGLRISHALLLCKSSEQHRTLVRPCNNHD
jgi:hypothetical protein